ncbi:MAG: UPF0280 family protein [Candidatus Altiarchaeota archaeon]|nr:UPF0280 family protein [Candidatus Altiarchaeota archaeon]
MPEEGAEGPGILMIANFEFKDTILKVRCDRDISDKVKKFIVEKRQELEGYIARNPGFRTSLEPLDAIGGPKIAQIMAEAGKKADVGPMAAVAGTISELLADAAVGWGAGWIIVDNGGDICLCGDKEFTISIFAGSSPLSDRIGFRVNAGDKKLGICTSSASVGHSISFGDADSVTVVAKSAPLADAFATAIGNESKGKRAIERGIGFASRHLGSIDGALVIKGDRIGRVGVLPDLVKIVH